jgi:hypothetical protein
VETSRDSIIARVSVCDAVRERRGAVSVPDSMEMDLRHITYLNLTIYVRRAVAGDWSSLCRSTPGFQRIPILHRCQRVQPDLHSTCARDQITTASRWSTT